ncbi:SRPBCC family protein [Streptomyces avicenniae]|uniref:SRPBCC family protein n=1 Tax=Streptomyces avicenniae TaxID=500153 RepID=UPI00069B7425|nr:SRPBCC family protein [Streptomyces avicenniae]
MANSDTADQDSKGGKDGKGGASDVLTQSMERLGHELTGFLTAQIHRLADRAGGKLGGVAGQVGQNALHPTQLPKTGAKLAGAGASKAKDSAVGSVKKAVPGMGGGDDDDSGGDDDGGGKGGGKGKGGSAGGKFTSIIETIDVGLPLSDCYRHWTSYEDFGDFMKGVQSVQRSDETTTDWKLKVGPSSRGWKATVQEQIPYERIEWTSEGAQGSTTGVVSFHELAPKLTRIVLVVQYYPAGFFEKTANIWRAAGRRIRLDLKNFQRYVTLEADEVPEGWLGEIRDGEVVQDHEPDDEDQGDDDQDDQDEEEDDEDDEAEDEEKR